MEQKRVVRRRTDAYRYAPDEDIVVTEYVEEPSGAESLRRIVIFIFTIVQVVLVLRIVGQLVDAQRSNELVRVIYDVGAILVAPFEGIIRTASAESGSSVLDLTAIVALISYTLLELIIVAAIGILRREPA